MKYWPEKKVLTWLQASMDPVVLIWVIKNRFDFMRTLFQKRETHEVVSLNITKARSLAPKNDSELPRQQCIGTKTHLLHCFFIHVSVLVPPLHEKVEIAQEPLPHLGALLLYILLTTLPLSSLQTSY